MKRTVTRQANALLSRMDYALARKMCAASPKRIYLELSNRCNLNCRMCPTNKNEYPVKSGLMTVDTFKEIVDHFGNYAYRVSLHNWGEPLLNPQLLDFVNYGVLRGLDVKFSTNLTLLDENLAQDLVRSSLHGLTVSIPAGTAETYREYTGKDEFQTVLENLRILRKCKSEKRVSKPTVTWLFVLGRFNQHEVGVAQRLSVDMGVDEFVTIPIRLMPSEEIFLTTEEKIAQFGEWIPSVPAYNRYAPDGRSAAPRKRCRWPWERLVVDWDGTVYPCCLAFGKRGSLTHLSECPLGRLWNSRPFVSARKACCGEGEDSTPCDVCYRNGFNDFLP